MADKELIILLFLLNGVILTHLQIIHNHQERCKNNMEEDLLMQVKELQLEFLSCRQKSLENEKLLQDQINKMKNNSSIHRSELLQQQKELEGKMNKSEQSLDDRLSQMEKDFAVYRNMSQEKLLVLEDDLKRQGDELNEIQRSYCSAIKPVGMYF